MQATVGSKKNRIIFYILIFIFLSTINFFEKTENLEKKNFFHVDKIEIFGTKKVNKQVLQLRLDSLLGKNLIFINIKDIGSIIYENKLIKEFTINKQYPNKIKIKLKEVNLVATFVKDKKKYFLADNNNLIPFDVNLMKIKLPIIYGKGAEYYFNDFQELLISNNFDTDIISSYYFFPIKRWDLLTNNQKTIKFPSNNLEEAIKVANRLLNNEDFDEYFVIDLRINNKIITQ